jgi:hypothetical protein
MTRDWAAYAKSTYQWKPGHELHLRITKSSLTSDFDYCPKQYEYKRLHKLPEHSTDPMRRGINVHDAIEQFYVNVVALVGKAHSHLVAGKREKAMVLFQQALPIPEKPYVLGEQAAIDSRLALDLDRLLGDGVERFLPIINELELHAFVDETIEFNGETITIPIHYAGMIDRGFRNKEGGVELMELKTGKWIQTRKIGGDWTDSRFTVAGMRTEMAFYKHLLQLCDHEYQNVTHWGWIYPSGALIEVPPENKFGHEQRSINRVWLEPCTGRRNTDYTRIIRRDTDALITAYLTETFPPEPSTGKCAYCSFKAICPAWGGSDDPEEYRKAWEAEEE